MAEVKLVNVSKIYDSDNKAVKNVSFTVNDNEFVVLVGPTGCGKSTILRMIAGLEDISEGELFIDNKLMNDVLPAQRDIAMVFQNYALYPHMTVFENMAFGLKLRKYPKEEIKTRVIIAAKILGIEELLDKKPKQLSGGQKQRVAVGRAIVRNPKVFLFDEPLSNLDAKMRVQMRAEITKLHQQLKATMIYVTHDQVEAMTMGDRIIVLKDGEIQQIDTPMNLYKNPVNKFVAGFIGSPSMNFIEGIIIQGEDLQFRSLNGSLMINLTGEQKLKLGKYIDKKIYLGIRPENISLQKHENRHEFVSILDLVEPMGNEIFIYFKVDENQFIGKVYSNEIYRKGEKVHIYLDKNKFYFFDYEKELAIN
ncbi:MAG: sn-glycerol-3-phosphate ABC transporter ATP-binding protein UgpC [Melioribacter sp.]|uniref:ABC transporter ATP-binding protein n=1 Tax=Rosettibacter primus TaxID=3111523 RepID=UPI00247CE83E|nr:sn-glycerol-3-phosphate ABC transporter ATP-binding protein UgpC [Melioribacter sp.]